MAAHFDISKVLVHTLGTCKTEDASVPAERVSTTDGCAKEGRQHHGSGASRAFVKGSGDATIQSVLESSAHFEILKLLLEEEVDELTRDDVE